MAFLIRRPFIYIIIGIVALVLILQFSGVFSPKSTTIVITPSLSPSSIKMNANATLTAVIENKGSRSYSVGYHIVFSSNLLVFSNTNGTLLPNPVSNGKNYTVTYPKVWNMGSGESGTVVISVKGLNPGQASFSYVIYLEAWADGALADRKTVQLTVTQS